LIAQLQDALARVKTLTSLLPICAGCKHIRDNKGYWHKVEAYLVRHTEARFSHGLCPECVKKSLTELEIMKAHNAFGPQRPSPF
jgi:hypothetical protein